MSPTSPALYVGDSIGDNYRRCLKKRAVYGKEENENRQEGNIEE